MLGGAGKRHVPRVPRGATKRECLSRSLSRAAASLSPASGADRCAGAGGRSDARRQSGPGHRDARLARPRGRRPPRPCVPGAPCACCSRAGDARTKRDRPIAGGCGRSSGGDQCAGSLRRIDDAGRGSDAVGVSICRAILKSREPPERGLPAQCLRAPMRGRLGEADSAATGALGPKSPTMCTPEEIRVSIRGIGSGRLLRAGVILTGGGVGSL